VADVERGLAGAGCSGRSATRQAGSKIGVALARHPSPSMNAETPVFAARAIASRVSAARSSVIARN
jgi:hypothetical protein